MNMLYFFFKKFNHTVIHCIGILKIKFVFPGNGQKKKSSNLALSVFCMLHLLLLLLIALTVISLLLIVLLTCKFFPVFNLLFIVSLFVDSRMFLFRIFSPVLLFLFSVSLLFPFYSLFLQVP